MKRIVLFILTLLLAFNLYAQDARISIDSLNFVISEQIKGLASSIYELQQVQLRISGRIDTADRGISTLQDDISSLSTKTQMNETAINNLERSMSSKLSEATEAYQIGHDTLSSSIHSRTLFGCMTVIIIVLAVIILFLFLRNKIDNGTNAVESIRKAQRNMQEETLKLDNKLLDIFDTQLKIHKETSSSGKKEEIDHSLALKVADELTRIETNLSRMDSGIKGYKQLMASLKRIKDNYLANGYEIVDMLGKPYNDGMKVIANFVPDENLKDGEQVITGIVKPQVNYKGQMIQAAQITVSQN